MITIIPRHSFINFIFFIFSLRNKMKIGNKDINPEDIETRIYLDVSFKEKDEAKSMGAKWDSQSKRWYTSPDRVDIINKWYDSRVKVYLAVPFTEKDDVKKKLSSVFGNDILNEKGKISRAKLRQKTVLDKEKLHRLNEILHPFIKETIWNLLKQEKSKIVVIEAALIFEVGWDFFLDKTVAVYCSQEKQIERIRKNTNLTFEEIQAFLHAQLPLEEKIKRADLAIANEKDTGELEIRAREVFDEIIREATGGSKS